MGVLSKGSLGVLSAGVVLGLFGCAVGPSGLSELESLTGIDLDAERICNEGFGPPEFVLEAARLSSLEEVRSLAVEADMEEQNRANLDDDLDASTPVALCVVSGDVVERGLGSESALYYQIENNQGNGLLHFW